MATRLYLHDALFDTVTYPGNYPDSGAEVGVGNGSFPATPTPDYNQEDLIDVHRSMDKTIGTSAVNKDWTTNSGTLTQMNYITKFITPPLDGNGTISAEQWLGQFAYYENNLSCNWTFIAGTLFVWRPSTDALVGYIYGYTAFHTTGEPGAINSYRMFRGNFTAGVGASVSYNDGDVIVISCFQRHQQAATGPYNVGMQYDGTNEYTGSANNTATSSDFAAYIETPQNLMFVTDIPAEVDATSDYKDVLQQSPQQLITNSI